MSRHGESFTSQCDRWRLRARPGRVAEVAAVGACAAAAHELRDHGRHRWTHGRVGSRRERSRQRASREAEVAGLVGDSRQRSLACHLDLDCCAGVGLERCGSGLIERACKLVARRIWAGIVSEVATGDDAVQASVRGSDDTTMVMRISCWCDQVRAAVGVCAAIHARLGSAIWGIVVGGSDLADSASCEQQAGEQEDDAHRGTPGWQLVTAGGMQGAAHPGRDFEDEARVLEFLLVTVEM